jgi:hypothetical protein
MDTSMPFNYAFAGDNRWQPGVRRPDNYFDLPVEAFPDIERYVKKYLTWAQ